MHTQSRHARVSRQTFACVATTVGVLVALAMPASAAPGDAASGGNASGGGGERERERAAAAAVSDLVNQDRLLAPRYTDPEDITSKTLLELLREARSQPETDDQWMQDPLVYLEQDMSRAVEALSKHRSDKPVQDQQAEILRKMDVLIAQLEEAQKNMQSACGGGQQAGDGQGGGPMQDSQLGGGPGGMGDLRDPSRPTKQWTDLPPKDREKILQSTTEGFPAGYEEVLEEYYRRLADTEATRIDTTPTITPSTTDPDVRGEDSP